MDIVVENLPQTDVQTGQSAAESTNPVAHLAIAQRFNIGTPTKEEEGKLIEIWEHGKTLSKTGDMQDVMWQIIHLQRTLGAPKLGESPLDKVYRWAKLKRQQSQIEEELHSV